MTANTRHRLRTVMCDPHHVVFGYPDISNIKNVSIVSHPSTGDAGYMLEDFSSPFQSHSCQLHFLP
jgi:hypothetical protein